MANPRPLLNPFRIFFAKSFSRFGLRTLLLAVAGCAVLLGYWNWKYAPVARALDRLESEEVFVEYDEELTEEESGFEAWMYRLSGITTSPNSITQIIGSTNGDLDGLQHFPNLRIIDLSGPNISDLRPIAGLKNLKSLDLASDHIVDVSPLEGLTGLLDLSISSQGLTDVTSLGHCHNLQYLELVDCGVWDMSALSNLKKLTDLNLSGSPVQDIRGLSTLVNLTYVNVSNTSVQSLLPLENLTGVIRLSMDGSPIKSLQGIEKLVGLTELDLSETLINDLQPLANLKDLSSLKLINTQVENLESLPNLPGIHNLEVGGKRLKSLSGLAKAMPRSLRGRDGIDVFGSYGRRGVDIAVAECPITDLGELGNVLSLTGLYLRSIPARNLPIFKSQSICYAKIINVPVADFRPIEGQPLSDLTIESPSAHFESSFLSRLKCFDSLIQLTIKDAAVGDLAVLSPMEMLFELNLTQCDLSNFEALANLDELEELTLDDTDLRNIEWIGEMELLSNLSIANTRVSNVDPVSDLFNLRSLNLSGCPVSDLDALSCSINELILNRTEIRDLNFVRRLSELERLQICDTDVSDLTPLVETQQPGRLLKIAGVGLVDPASIEKLIWIQALDISGTNITDPHSFDGYTYLSYLVVEDVEIDLVKLKRSLPKCEILLKRTEVDWYPFTWSGGCFF